MASKLKAGDTYTGPKAIMEIDGVVAHYALTKDGPVRLIHIDLAPDNPSDGSEEFRVAGPGDPVSTAVSNGSTVEMEVEEINLTASTEV